MRTACARHHGRCAFSGAEPDRCPFCHTTEEAVLKCTAHCCLGSPWHHIRQHEQHGELVAAGKVLRRAGVWSSGTPRQARADGNGGAA